ncbi:MAG: MBL fold metallo-hydrolase [Nanoarchaeota archaeon]
MKLIFHGAVREVGRSCIELVTQQARFLLDAGIKLGTETGYPEEIKNIKEITAGILSHAHLDHCGAWPYLVSKGLNCPIYTTSVTKDLARILMKDFYKVECLNHIPPYNQENTEKAIELINTVRYRTPFEIKDAYFKFFDAGHIPGSAFILIESNNKKLVYTGDINLMETRLIKGADLNLEPIDAIIMEATYGNKEHPNRQQTEKEFLSKVKETLKRGGKVFIAAFAVGRTQELMLLLNSKKWNVPIYVDGMGKDMTEIMIHHDAVKDKTKMIDARNKIKAVRGRMQREDALKKQGIFISSAGMMTGGPIIDYLKQGHQDPKNIFLLTGYVDDGTNGRMLLDEGTVFIEGRKTKVQAEYGQYNFSAHSGERELKEIVETLKPKKVILVHGEKEAMENLADYLRKKGKEVFIPELGSEINI